MISRKTEVSFDGILQDYVTADREGVPCHRPRLVPILGQPQPIGCRMYSPYLDNIPPSTPHEGPELLLAVPEQAAIMALAKHVVAAHGAGLTNLVFCSPAARVLEVFGPK
jgi:hypothetical protein